MRLVVIERLPGERNEDYCLRAISQARRLKKTVVVMVEERFVEVSPNTSLEYLLGYFSGYEDGIRGRVGFWERSVL